MAQDEAMLDKVRQAEIDEHTSCAENWKRRFDNGAVAITMHPVEAHRHCRKEFDFHSDPHRLCFLDLPSQV